MTSASKGSSLSYELITMADAVSIDIVDEYVSDYPLDSRERRFLLEMGSGDSSSWELKGQKALGPPKMQTTAHVEDEKPQRKMATTESWRPWSHKGSP